MPLLLKKSKLFPVSASAKPVGQSPLGQPAYVLISGKVFDVAEFIPAHPGGDVILTHVNGEDATDVFTAFHPESAHDVLANYYVGDLDPEDGAVPSEINQFAREIQELRSQILGEGLFQSSKLFYAYKNIANLSILAMSIAVLAWRPNSIWNFMVSAALMGLYWQQSGWLAHDYCHHQVFQDRFWNNLFGYFWGNVVQGFSVGWWKNKHNSHHAAPNIHGVDPDIATMPVLGWSSHAIEDFGRFPQDPLTKFFVFNQAALYFVILTFARLSWCWQSILFSMRPNIQNKTAELLTLGLHWSSYFAFMIYFLSWPKVLLYLVVSQGVSGFLLALVFSLNHNGMPIFDKEQSVNMEFYQKQVLTGRDVFPNLFSTWFTGGLNYQIEHHLFPSLPRHNFHKVAPRVKALCKKYGVLYHSTGIIDGTLEVLNRLGEVSDLAKQAHQKL